MSLQPDYDLLCSLRHMREKMDRDPAPRTTSVDELYRLLARRIAELESTARLMDTRQIWREPNDPRTRHPLRP